MRRDCINRPLSLFTEWSRQMDLKNMFHVLENDRNVEKQAVLKKELGDRFCSVAGSASAVVVH